MRQKAVILGALASIFAVSVFGQSGTQSNADRIIDRALAGSRAYETLSYLTDSIGPRLSGTKNAELAVQWTTKQLRGWGLETRNQPVMVPHWVRGAERARLVSHNDQRIVLTTLGMSVGTPADGITADVIEVTSYEQLAELGRAKIAGKIVFYNQAMDMALVESGQAFDAYSKAVVFRSEGASKAAHYGAAAALVRSVASASLRTPHTGAMNYDQAEPRIPAAAITTEDADLVQRLLAKGERVRMHLVLTPRLLPEVRSANVIAEIRGTERPNEIVIVGAHLDSWDLGTGAIDNGSGVAMVMETMRILNELGLRPKRTIRGVLFMNEENGLRGGKQYFNEAAKREELTHHIAAIETDAGAAPPTGFITTLSGAALERIQSRARFLNRIAPMKFSSSKHTGADTSPLTDAGIPGFGLIPNPRHYFDYHHTPADTLDKIDPHALAQNTATVAALAYLLAEEGL